MYAYRPVPYRGEHLQVSWVVGGISARARMAADKRLPATSALSALSAITAFVALSDCERSYLASR